MLSGFLVSQSDRALPVLSRYGSRGEEVRQIQTKLRDLGYDVGTVDGIYGSKTQAAVRKFQADRGLTVDGIAGSRTLSAMGISGGGGGGSNTRNLDTDLLARTVSAEAKGEPYIGQVAVAAVILNRLDHPSFPNTLSGVVYQPGAFEPVQNGTINQPATASAIRATQEALAGNDPTHGAIYFYNPDTATSKWIRSRPVVAVIGDHLFCT
ncbi:MAG: spore cortex-lytic enzyme [Clostridiales bacterium]|nr:spore cortex-lytic enzyme [Clostridiales bacterium]